MEKSLLISLILKATNQASATLRKVAEDINGVSRRTAVFREAAGNLALTGGVMLGAGGAIAYGLKQVAETMVPVEDQLHRLRNTLPAGAEGMRQLADAQRASAEMSTQMGIAQEGVLKQMYLGTSAGLSMKESITAANVASELAIGLNGDLEATQRTLNLAYINFKNPSLTAAQNIKQLGDVMAIATSKFDYKNIEELRSQIELATPTALAAGVSFKDMVAALADFTRHGLTGGVAGEAFEESLHGVLKMSQKLGIQTAYNTQGGLDYTRSLANIRAHFIAMYGSMSAIPLPILKQLQETFGLRGMRALLLNKSEMEGMRKQLDDNAGAAQRFFGEMQKSPTQQFAVLQENLKSIAKAFAPSILESAINLSHAIIPIAKAAAAFAQAHPGWVKMAITGAMITAGVLAIGGALALAGSALLGFAGFIPNLLAFARAVRVITAAQWLFNAALAANPIALAIIAVAALGVAIYEIVKHWQSVKDFLASTVPFFQNLAKQIDYWLFWPFRQLPEHVKAAWTATKGAVAGLAGEIAKFFVGHSPPPAGPLHELNFGRTIASTFQPGPVINAARAAAASLALAMPLMMPSGGIPIAASRTGGSQINIQFTANVRIEPGGKLDASSKAELDKYFESKGKELLRLVERAEEARARTEY